MVATHLKLANPWEPPSRVIGVGGVPKLAIRAHTCQNTAQVGQQWYDKVCTAGQSRPAALPRTQSVMVVPRKGANSDLKEERRSEKTCRPVLPRTMGTGGTRKTVRVPLGAHLKLNVPAFFLPPHLPLTMVCPKAQALQATGACPVCIEYVWVLLPFFPDPLWQGALALLMHAECYLEHNV